jgi:hypothetical protein
MDGMAHFSRANFLLTLSAAASFVVTDAGTARRSLGAFTQGPLSDRQ